MDRKQKGRLAEAKAIAWFVENEYDVYIPLSDCTSVDLVVIKNGITERVSVKYTSTKENSKYKVSLSNNTRSLGGNTIRPYDQSSVDLLAVYIGPEDRLVVIDSPSVKYAVAVI